MNTEKDDCTYKGKCCYL